MEHHRFDGLVRALAVSGSRRALSALLGGAVSWLTIGLVAPGADVASKKKKQKNQQDRKRRQKGKVRVEGPCGDGSPKKNDCKRDNQCCTGYCRRGRCRCRALNQSCTEDRNCCPERAGHTCQNGTCQPAPACGDVCASGCQFTSIQEAIDDADSGDTIRLCAETYRETIDISKDLTLVGTGEEGTILDGDGAGIVVVLDAPVTVAIRNLTITGRNSPSAGGGILSVGATLTLNDCTVSGNTSSGHGGGIFNDGTLTLNDCTVTGNTAGQNGGGIFNGLDGTLTLTGGTVTGNTAGGFGGGIFNGLDGTLTLNDCAVSGNEAGQNGGGIVNFGGTVTLQAGTTVTDNDAGDDGGGVYNDGANGDGTSICSGGGSVTGNTPNDCVAVNGGSCDAC